jgi:hypothetical protein
MILRTLYYLHSGVGMRVATIWETKIPSMSLFEKWEIKAA